ncbi:hypothetical protein SGPA1_40499 [Streptomyces misionensis JCM 4497]
MAGVSPSRPAVPPASSGPNSHPSDVCRPSVADHPPTSPEDFVHHIAPVPVPAVDPSWTGARPKPGSDEQPG